MQVRECMTREVRVADPGDPIAEAATLMAKVDAGVLPVCDGDKLVGMITDRDIAVRAVAERKGPDTKVRDVMSPEVRYCFEDDDVENVLRNMAENQVRRLPVVDNDKRLVGIISLGDLATNSRVRDTGEALGDISQPGGQHSQTAH